MKKTITLFFITIILSGCAGWGMTAGLQKETARQLDNVAWQEVNISNVDREHRGISWDAGTPKGMYKCKSPDIPKNVVCTKQ